MAVSRNCPRGGQVVLIVVYHDKMHDEVESQSLGSWHGISWSWLLIISKINEMKMRSTKYILFHHFSKCNVNWSSDNNGGASLGSSTLLSSCTDGVGDDMTSFQSWLVPQKCNHSLNPLMLVWWLDNIKYSFQNPNFDSIIVIRDKG